MEKYIWSPSSMGFFPVEERINFEALGLWPKDGVGISEEAHAALFPAPEGKIIDTVGGMPAWVDIPPPTRDEKIAAIEGYRSGLLARADVVTADWRTELALGEISDADKTNLSAWMAYKRQVKAIRAETAIDDGFTWPATPSA